MSRLPNIVYISSDSSSEEEAIFMSSSSEGAGWGNYIPPCASSSSTMKPNKKISTPAPSLEFYSSSSDDDDETYTLSKELPKALTQAPLSNMKKIPVLKKPARLPKPPKQVLGLASPRMWSTFENQRKSAQKAKHNYKGKGKKPME